MKTLATIVISVTLSAAAAYAISTRNSASSADEPNISTYHPYELSSTKIICDREHTAFDLAGNTYCQQPPTLKGTSVPLAPTGR